MRLAFYTAEIVYDEILFPAMSFWAAMRAVLIASCED